MALVAALVALFLPVASSADWLLTVDGQRIETLGPWEVEGDRIVFTLPNGTLTSVRAEEIDLPASLQLTEWAKSIPSLPPGWISITPPPREPPAEIWQAAMKRALEDEEIPREVKARRRRLTELEDDERPDREIASRLFGRPLIVGGGYNLAARFDGDLRPDNDLDEARSRQRQELELEFFYQAGAKVSLFVEARVAYQSELETLGEGSSDSKVSLRAGEVWLHWDEIGDSAWSLQIGRQTMRDRRRWWWSGKLDALRLLYDRGPVELELAVAETFRPLETEQPFVDPEDEDVVRALGSFSWRYGRRHWLEFFALAHRDRSETPLAGEVLTTGELDRNDAELDWFGMRMRGDRRWGRGGSFGYWGDAGLVQGRETLIDFDDIGGDRIVVDGLSERQVRGWGIDLGMTWRASGGGAPALTLGYALGSGDREPGDLQDRSFRQSGLESNSGRFRGVHGFRYYGELLQPELSNMEILTLATGFRFLRSSSIEVVSHRYRQVEPTPFLRGTRFRSRPDGVSRELGTELDLVLGIQEWQHARFRLFGSAFWPGSAFPLLTDEIVYGGRAQAQFVF